MFLCCELFYVFRIFLERAVRIGYYYAKMPHCVVHNCSNRTSSKSKRQVEIEEYTKITFHRFPKAEDRRLKWANAVGLEFLTQCKNAYICSLHFPKESFDRTSVACVRLKDHAIPCLKKADFCKLEHDYSLPHPNQEDELWRSEKVQTTSTDNEVLAEKTAASFGETLLSYHGNPKLHIKSEEVHEIDVPKRRCITTIFDETIVQPTPLTCDVCTQTPAYPDAAIKLEPMDGRGAAASPDQTWDSPRESLLRKTMQHQKETSRKQIQALKKRNERQKKKIAELKSILKDIYKGGPFSRGKFRQR